MMTTPTPATTRAERVEAALRALLENDACVVSNEVRLSFTDHDAAWQKLRVAREALNAAPEPPAEGAVTLREIDHAISAFAAASTKKSCADPGPETWSASVATEKSRASLLALIQRFAGAPQRREIADAPRERRAGGGVMATLNVVSGHLVWYARDYGDGDNYRHSLIAPRDYDNNNFDQRMLAQECADHYYWNHDGWEASWPLDLIVYESQDGPELFRAEVECVSVPIFTATITAPTPKSGA